MIHQVLNPIHLYFQVCIPESSTNTFAPTLPSTIVHINLVCGIEQGIFVEATNLKINGDGQILSDVIQMVTTGYKPFESVDSRKNNKGSTDHQVNRREPYY